jgi:hypothetical protein
LKELCTLIKVTEKELLNMCKTRAISHFNYSIIKILGTDDFHFRYNWEYLMYQKSIPSNLFNSLKPDFINNMIKIYFIQCEREIYGDILSCISKKRYEMAKILIYISGIRLHGQKCYDCGREVLNSDDDLRTFENNTNRIKVDGNKHFERYTNNNCFYSYDDDDPSYSYDDEEEYDLCNRKQEIRHHNYDVCICINNELNIAYASRIRNIKEIIDDIDGIYGNEIIDNFLPSMFECFFNNEVIRIHIAKFMKYSNDKLKKLNIDDLVSHFIAIYIVPYLMHSTNNDLIDYLVFGTCDLAVHFRNYVKI